MRQEFCVGHRSSLVSGLGMTLLVLGLIGLLLALLGPMSTVPAVTLMTLVWSALAIVTGHALWRRLEWARRCAAWLLASLLPALMLGLWLLEADLPLLATMPLSGAIALLLTWALSRLNSTRVRQEFA